MYPCYAIAHSYHGPVVAISTQCTIVLRSERNERFKRSGGYVDAYRLAIKYIYLFRIIYEGWHRHIIVSPFALRSQEVLIICWINTTCKIPVIPAKCGSILIIHKPYLLIQV